MLPVQCSFRVVCLGDELAMHGLEKKRDLLLLFF